MSGCNFFWEIQIEGHGVSRNLELAEAATNHWSAVMLEAQRMRRQRILDLFSREPARARDMWVEGAGLELDFSKNLIDETALLSLIDMVEARALAHERDMLFAGAPVNNTENQSALHMAFRGTGPEAEVRAAKAARDRACGFARQVRANPARFGNVLCLGVGGADLGPRLVIDALAPYAKAGPTVHFVASCDAAELSAVLESLDPRTTLLIITSKSFRTQETMANARAAYEWLKEAHGGALPDDAVAAVTANRERTREFGVPADMVFDMFEWVGGRYSVWSTASLAAMIRLGPELFTEFLDGAAAMDRHFQMAPLRQNLPVLLAVLNIWYVNFMNWSAQAIIPYNFGLSLLPEYMSQLVMESNGKRVDKAGMALPHATAPVTFGVTGTKAQHSFFQALHQGPVPVPVDFIGSLEGAGSIGPKHDVLVANMFAQAEALMTGQFIEADEGSFDSHRTCPGNRPTNMILMPRLDARHLGALVAMYEHRVFVESVIWGINPFDQWGVELGKTLAGAIAEDLSAGQVSFGRDPSTTRLMARYLAFKKG